MFCSKCGTELKEGDVFCYKCGAPMRNKENAVSNDAGSNKPVNLVNNIQNAADNKVEKGSAKKKKIGSVPFIICLLVLAGVVIWLVCKQLEIGAWTSSQNNKESKKDIKVTNVNVGGYKFTIPEEYEKDDSESIDEGGGSAHVFYNKDGYEIDILIYPNTDGLDGEYIKQNIKDIAQERYQQLGLDHMHNGGISSAPAFSLGSLKGARANYPLADKNLRQIIILANEKDVCEIYLFGMGNDRDIIDVLSGEYD